MRPTLHGSTARPGSSRLGRCGRYSGPCGLTPRPGSSLLEALCALALLGALAALAWPAASRARDRWAARTARDAFAALHVHARRAALAAGRTARLALEPDSGRARLRLEPRVEPEPGSLPAADAPAGEPRDPDVLAELDFGREFPGVEVEARRRVFCFGPRGLPVVGPGCDLPNATLVFRRGAAAETATVSVAGRLLRW